MQKEYSNIALLKRHLSPLGYSARDFSLDGELFTQFMSSGGHTWMTNNEKIYYPFPSIGSKMISKSKIWSNEIVSQLGVNIPKTYPINQKDVKIVNLGKIIALNGTVIVKPFNSTLSQGLTTDVTDVDGLNRALTSAYAYSSTALVQEQVYGDDVRFIILNGTVVGVLLRQTPRVTGDGVKTLAELIIEENLLRANLRLPFDQHYRTLTAELIPASFLASKAVLSVGETKELSREVLVRKGASINNISDTIHTSYVKSIEDIANQLGKGYIAVDVFIADYTMPKSNDNYWFLEFNSSPLLALPYCVRDGNHVNVLDTLIPMLDRAITNSL